MYSSIQKLLVERLPRLGELTFGCEVKSDYGISTVISSGETDGEEWMTFKLWDGTIGGEEHVSSVGSFEILGHPFTHADILEALGGDWVLSPMKSLVQMKYSYELGGYNVLEMIKLPQNLKDLNKPEYKETCERLISLIK